MMDEAASPKPLYSCCKRNGNRPCAELRRTGRESPGPTCTYPLWNQSRAGCSAAGPNSNFQGAQLIFKGLCQFRNENDFIIKERLGQ